MKHGFDEALQPSVVLKLKKNAKREFIFSVVVVGILTLLSLSLEIEFVEAFYEFTRQHEEWELDEILVCLSLLGIFAIGYAARRMLDIRTLNQELLHKAYIDQITDLPNRVLAFDILERQILEANSKGKEIVVAFIDIDNFKAVNDSYGHDQGDLLVRQLSSKLLNSVASDATLCRVGGDELLLFKMINDKNSDLPEMLGTLQKAQGQEYSVGGNPIAIDYSIGISIFPQDGSHCQDLFKAANVAMYEAKKSMAKNVHFYSHTLGHRLSERHQLAQDLKLALQQDLLFLVYQPIVNFSKQHIVSYEALLRWQNNGEYVNPETLIAVAHEYGLFNDVENWVFKNACLGSLRLVKDNQKVAVNVSAQQFLHTNFISTVKNTLAETQVSAKQIEIEITESAIISDFEFAIARIAELKTLGFSIAIDDFGIGYSSLGRLKALSVDKLKIDRAFIKDIEDNDKDIAIVSAVCQLASDLGMSVVAEGIETYEQAKILESINCLIHQGFYFSRPLPIDQQVSIAYHPIAVSA